MRVLDNLIDGAGTYSAKVKVKDLIEALSIVNPELVVQVGYEGTSNPVTDVYTWQDDRDDSVCLVIATW